jgi:GNAT superfamily N-acetyltransferase
MSSPIVRPLTPEEIAELVTWAGEEGWNPGLNDARAFTAADPEGFIGCFVDGAMAASISAVRYGSDFGFIGLYICKPEHRGKGYGRRVWDAGMATLAGRTVGLDGVPEQQANYASMGFAPVYETVRWSGRITPASPSGQTQLVSEQDDLEKIIAFDRAYFPGPRTSFLSLWLAEPHRTRAIFRDKNLAGYGVLRKCLDGFKLGPLFARDDAAAKALLQALACDCGGDTIHIDVPAPQTEFSRHLMDVGFSAGFTTARMYRGRVPDIDMSGIFGISTLELG